jgi:uncharacterized membrane protein
VGGMRITSSAAIAMLFLAFILLAASASAQEIASANYQFDVQKSKTVITGYFSMKESTMIDVGLDLPNDAFDVSLTIDGIPRRIIYADEAEKKLRIKNIAKDITLQYSTRDFMKSSAFFVTIKTFYPTTSMDVKVTLPEGYTLQNPVRGETFETGSVYPMPSSVESDGQSMVFTWHLSDLEANDTFSLLMLLKQKFPVAIIILASVLILAAGGVGFYIYERKKKPKVIIEKVERIEEHLKENEEQIINIIKQRGGSCEQGTLKVIMNIPKSSLSGLLSELEERKIIYKQKKGKKNIISLKK